MKVTLAQLQVFVALSDTLHFTRAAEALSVSQPTISKEIKALERGLGIQLLNRSSGGTTLTPAGRSLQGHARAVITQVTEFEASAEVVKRHARREVRIAASPSIVNRLLPETLRKQIPCIGDHPTFVIMHNDAVVQGLSEIPRMAGAKAWAAVTIGTGLGNASFVRNGD